MKLIAITPKKEIFDLPGFHKKAATVLNRTNNTIKSDFEKTTRTWNDKPTFIQDKATTQKLEAQTYTNHLIYFFITRGTRVRYATMTPDFSRKTNPRIIGSRRGRGGVAFISRRFPRPGIKAREFDDEIAKRRQPVLVNRLDKAVRDSIP